MIRVDVAVVGAGLAGLVAARHLARAGVRTVVVEARDRVGGRTWSKAVSDGVVIDMGGQWIGPVQARMTALADELGLETFVTYSDGDTHRAVPGFDENSFGALLEVFADLDRMAAEVPLDAPWTAPHAKEWDSQTLHTWFSERVKDPGVMAMARLVATALFTAEADELSLLHTLVYVRSAGSIANLTGVIGGAQERRFVLGAQEVSNRLAAELGGERVRLNSPVRRIDQNDEVVIIESEELRVEARRAIVAVPVPLADRIVYSPALPGYRSQMHQRMAPGAVIKIHCVYETPFWRARGSNGRVMTDSGPVTVTFDNSPHDAKRGVLVGFVEADEARHFCLLPEADRRKAAIDCLVRFFGADAAKPIEYIETSWSEEEWTRGCYGGNFPPGGWTRYGWVLREPFGRVHWAGAETSTIWMNYMEGAVRSGERAANEVIAALR
jgi:monoamine oxidase